MNNLVILEKCFYLLFPHVTLNNLNMCSGYTTDNMLKRVCLKLDVNKALRINK